MFWPVVIAGSALIGWIFYEKNKESSEEFNRHLEEQKLRLPQQGDRILVRLDPTQRTLLGITDSAAVCVRFVTIQQAGGGILIGTIDNNSKQSGSTVQFFSKDIVARC